MSTDDRTRKQRIAERLEEPADEANNLAERLGLRPFDDALFPRPVVGAHGSSSSVLRMV